MHLLRAQVTTYCHWPRVVAAAQSPASVRTTGHYTGRCAGVIYVLWISVLSCVARAIQRSPRSTLGLRRVLDTAKPVFVSLPRNNDSRWGIVSGMNGARFSDLRGVQFWRVSGDGSPPAVSRAEPLVGVWAKPPEAEETLQILHVQKVFRVSRVVSKRAYVTVVLQKSFCIQK